MIDIADYHVGGGLFDFTPLSLSLFMEDSVPYRFFNNIVFKYYNGYLISDSYIVDNVEYIHVFKKSYAFILVCDKTVTEVSTIPFTISLHIAGVFGSLAVFDSEGLKK